MQLKNSASVFNSEGSISSLLPTSLSRSQSWNMALFPTSLSRSQSWNMALEVLQDCNIPDDPFMEDFKEFLHFVVNAVNDENPTADNLVSSEFSRCIPTVGPVFVEEPPIFQKISVPSVRAHSIPIPTVSSRSIAIPTVSSQIHFYVEETELSRCSSAATDSYYPELSRCSSAATDSYCPELSRCSSAATDYYEDDNHFLSTNLDDVNKSTNECRGKVDGCEKEHLAEDLAYSDHDTTAYINNCSTIPHEIGTDEHTKKNYRKRKIIQFREKKRRRLNNKQYAYTGRSEVAASRPRVGGRFVKQPDAFSPLTM